MNPSETALKKRIRILLVLFMIAMVVNGLTASPAETELTWLLNHPALVPGFMKEFLENILLGLQQTNSLYPQLAYGYDWLAFAHVIIAIAFIGPYRDPVKNIWIIEWGMISCILVPILAFIAAPIRQIPWYWTLLDCSFGVLGIIPLYFARKWTRRLESMA